MHMFTVFFVVLNCVILCCLVFLHYRFDPYWLSSVALGLSHFINLQIFSVLYLAISPDGQSIVTGAGDESLRYFFTPAFYIQSRSILLAERLAGTRTKRQPERKVRDGGQSAIDRQTELRSGRERERERDREDNIIIQLFIRSSSTFIFSFQVLEYLPIP